MPAKPSPGSLCRVLSAACLLTLPWAGSSIAADAPPAAAPAATSPQLGLPPGALQILSQLPAFQPGLWEFQRTVESAARPTEPDKIAKCSDPLNDIRSKMTEMMHKGCRIQGMNHNGNRYRSNWSCPVEDGSVSVSNLITADTPTAYQDVNEARYEQKTSRTVVLAKRIGDCSPADSGPTK